MDKILKEFDYLYNKFSFNIIDNYKNLKIFTIGIEKIDKFLKIEGIIEGITEGITMDYLNL